MLYFYIYSYSGNTFLLSCSVILYIKILRLLLIVQIKNAIYRFKKSIIKDKNTSIIYRKTIGRDDKSTFLLQSNSSKNIN